MGRSPMVAHNGNVSAADTHLSSLAASIAPATSSSVRSGSIHAPNQRILNVDASESLPGVRSTLIIGGEADLLFGPGVQRDMAARIAHSDLVLFSGVRSRSQYRKPSVP